MLNYFFSLSGWIENLGVVPLFLFSALRLAPAFLLLLALLIFVILVFETIFLLHKTNKGRKITFKGLNVNFRVLFLVFSITYFQLVMAEERPIILTIGETFQIKKKETPYFSVTQSKCLKAKETNKKSNLVIKGVCKGYSEVLLWKSPEGISKKYSVYILGKKERFDLAQLLDGSKKLGVHSEFVGEKIILKGVISNLDQYQYIKRISKEFSKGLVNQTILEDRLAKSIISLIYQDLFNQGLRDFFCNYLEQQIDCYYSKFSKIPKSKIKFLKNKYFANFYENQTKDLQENYLVRLHIFQIERSDGKEIGFGLNKIKASLGDVFSNGIEGVLQNNQIALEQNALSLSTIAQPETILRLGTKGTIQLGSEIPFQTTTDNQIKTDWKFAGIKLNLKLVKQNGTLLLTYGTEVFRPSFGERVILSGAKNSSSLRLTLNKPINIFQVSLLTQNQQSSQIPLLGNAPILGKLFTSSLSSSQYKMIIGTIKIEKVI